MTTFRHTFRRIFGLRVAAGVCLSGLMAGCGTFAERTDPAGLQTSQPVSSSVQHVSLARLQERQGDETGARRIYEQVLRANPQEPTAHHRLGVLDARSGDFDRAIAHFEAARQAGVTSGELLNDLGYACYLGGDLASAERWLREAVRVDRRNTSAQNNLGLVLGALSRDSESLAAFRMAGSMAEAYNNMAWVLSQRGDIEGARRHYLMALDADPALKNAAEALVALANHEDTMTRIARRDDQRSPAAAPGRASVAVARMTPPQPARAAVTTPPPQTAPRATITRPQVSERNPVRVASARTSTSEPPADAADSEAARRREQQLWADIAPPEPVASTNESLQPAANTPTGRKTVTLADFAPEIRPARRPVAVPQITPRPTDLLQPEPVGVIEPLAYEELPLPRVEPEAVEPPLQFTDPHALPVVISRPDVPADDLEPMLEAHAPESPILEAIPPDPEALPPIRQLEPGVPVSPEVMFPEQFPLVRPLGEDQTKPNQEQTLQVSHEVEASAEPPVAVPAEPRRIDLTGVRYAALTPQPVGAPARRTREQHDSQDLPVGPVSTAGPVRESARFGPVDDSE